LIRFLQVAQTLTVHHGALAYLLGINALRASEAATVRIEDYAENAFSWPPRMFRPDQWRSDEAVEVPYRQGCSIHGRAHAEVTRPVAAQTRQRVAGTTPAGATRRVSLHDPDARPIAKGQLGKPVQFGYKAQVVDNEDGIVLDHNLEQGNPPDAPQLAPAIERVINRTRRTPRTVTADRGYGEKSVDDALHDLGVRHVMIPRKGKPGKARQAEEHRPTFRKTVKWRTGSEGRISSLKRGYGWDRTRLDGTEVARIWTGQGVFRPQPGQDRSPGQLNRTTGRPTSPRPTAGRLPISARRVFQVEVASSGRPATLW